MKRDETLLGFDFGRKRIGVAVGQTVSATASPLLILDNRKNTPWTAIGRLLRSWRPSRLIVGVPLHMDGTEQELTACARRFMRRLSGRYLLPVHGVDERLSTVEARRRAGPHAAHVDSLAAQIILESWLNEWTARQSGEPPAEAPGHTHPPCHAR